MSVLRKRKSRGASITSLIDVIFLLLLFFMLASTFSKKAEIEFATSAEGNSAGSEQSIVKLMVLPDSLQLDGHPVAETTLVSNIGQALSQQDGVITVELAEGVTTQRLVDILLMLRALPNARIHILEAS